MGIHEKLTRIPKHELQQVGWSKATELVKVARKDGEGFDCATWLHKAKEQKMCRGIVKVLKRRLAEFGFTWFLDSFCGPSSKTGGS